MINLSNSVLFLKALIKHWETYLKALKKCSKRWEKAKTKNIDAKEMSLVFAELAATYELVLPGLETGVLILRTHRDFKVVPPIEQLAEIHTLISIVIKDSKRQRPGPGTVYLWNSDYAETKRAMQPLNDISPGFSDDTLKALYSHLLPLSEFAKRASK
jgi:hypothetical protein